MNINVGTNPNLRVTYRTQAGALNQPPAAAQPPVNPGTPQPHPGSRFLDTVTAGLKTVVFESGAVLENDPALAVREFATRVHELASRGYGSSDLAAWSPYIGAGARTLILGANIMRTKRTLGTPTSSLLEKGLDVARVATDLAGVAGAVIRVAMPEHAALGTMMMGIAQSADLVSHGARFGMHSAPRVRGWLKEHEEDRAREKDRKKKAEEAGALG